MNSPRPMSGIFVSTSIPEPKKRRPKAPGSCYPSQARGREEISRSFCASPGMSFPVRRRSPGGRGGSPEPPMPQVLQRSSGIRPGQSSPAAPGSARMPRRSIDLKSSAEAAKTMSAIDGALRAVQATLTKSKLAAGDCSPSTSEDVESLCGTECTESTACSSSLSEDGGVDSRRVSCSLKDARRTLKERIGAEERSMRFTRGLLAKLDELRDAVAEDGTSAAPSR